jgi:hypothetical protein
MFRMKQIYMYLILSLDTFLYILSFLCSVAKKKKKLKKNDTMNTRKKDQRKVRFFSARHLVSFTLDFREKSRKQRLNKKIKKFACSLNKIYVRQIVK